MAQKFNRLLSKEEAIAKDKQRLHTVYKYVFNKDEYNLDPEVILQI